MAKWNKLCGGIQAILDVYAHLELCNLARRLLLFQIVSTESSLYILIVPY
jgi:hypothetical protein